MNLEKLRFPVGKYSPKEIKYDDLNQWMDDIENLPKELRKILKGIKDNELEYTYRPDGWNIRQVVHHIADSHMNAIIRFKLALTEDNPTIKPYLEAEWANLIDVTAVPIEASLQIIEGVHARLNAILRDLNVHEYARKYTHPEHGKSMDIAFTIGMYAWHGRHHTAHIKNALSEQKTDWK